MPVPILLPNLSILVSTRRSPGIRCGSADDGVRLEVYCFIVLLFGGHCSIVLLSTRLLLVKYLLSGGLFSRHARVTGIPERYPRPVVDTFPGLRGVPVAQYFLET